MISEYFLLPEILHVGTEKPAAYFIPFEKGENPKGLRETSSRFTLLNGNWDFKFYQNVRELDFENEIFPECEVLPDKMKVPFNWQLCLGKGYDVPNYINQDYPYPVDPPHLSDVIPAALYKRTFEINKKDGKVYYLTFEGVASCFYLWINGKFTGYSEVSHAESKFNVTDSLCDGENTVFALVIKHCTGSYLEDQDFFRLSGIFRDVYLTERDKIHLKDIHVKKDINEDLTEAEITVLPDFTEKCEFSYTLFAPSGEVVFEGKESDAFNLTLHRPILWNSEIPKRYNLLIEYGCEIINIPISLSKTEIKDRCFLFNNKKIKIYGINRHDSHPETGYSVTVEDMVRDLHILKRANVNTIRTSHYPNDPRFVDLCEKMGFMLVDEADIETHGMGYNYGDWYWDYWAYLSDTKEWEKAYLDRAERLFERDKNYGNIIMWSLGNESGCGENHRKMANFIRSRDEKAIIHYENAHLEYEARLNKDFKDISDVESRMYAPLDYLKNYLESDEHTKPFFYCEYVSATSTGDIPLHWGEFEDYDNYMGGCVWELTDHAVNIGTKENPKYRYGGDFGDYPNDKYYCVDGLIYPDRTPRPGFYDMKQTYLPIKAEYENGKLTVFNKRYFSCLSEYELNAEIEKDGKVSEKTVFSVDDISPRGKKEFEVQFDVSGENVTLNLYLVLKEDTEYDKKGFSAGHIQFVLANSPVKYKKGEEKTLSCSEDKCNVYVSAGEINFVFSKITGRITSVKNKREYLTDPVDFNMYRQSFCHKATYERARYDHIVKKTYSVNVNNKGDAVEICCDVSFAAAAMPPAVKGTAVYKFHSDASVEVSFDAKVTDNAPPLPRFGIRLPLIKDFEQSEYFGYGPKETYSDRYVSQRLSRFSSSVTDNYENYVNPCESSAHYKTKYAKVSTDKNESVEFYDTSDFGFSFKAIHFDDNQMENIAHHDELQELDSTIVNVDYKLHSENSGHADREPERAFTQKEFSFNYIIKVN